MRKRKTSNKTGKPQDEGAGTAPAQQQQQQSPSPSSSDKASGATPTKQGKGASGSSTPKVEKLDIAALLDETKTKINSIYRDVLDVVGENFHFKSRPSKGEIFSTPMVVFLGNHSSGKSTFINHLLNEPDLQTAGQAPMDDGFTLICHGNSRDEQLGPAIVNNTKLPYTSLSNIGDQFVEHLKMKFLPHPLLKQVTLVDSPGMIDSVGEGRGYDFAEAVRWFADRADYVLFFFDGEKPGTTGETLKIFTQSLSGMDHKLLILMNKVDTFKNIGDFVRTYGTLCWNLAKVIPYKDMPQIHTTFVPVDDVSGKSLAKHRPAPAAPASSSGAADSGSSSSSSSSSSSPAISYRSWSLAEFERAAEKVIKKVWSAPSRHADNMITELKRYIEHLLMHAQVISAARNRLWWARIKWWVGLVFFAFFTTFLVFHFNFDPSLRRASLLDVLVDPYAGVLPLMVGLLVLLVGGTLLIPHLLANAEKEMLNNLHPLFETAYAKELMGASGDYYRGLWEVVRPTSRFAIEKFGLLSFPSLSRKQQAQLHHIMTHEVEEMLDRVHTTLQL